ncbi:OLC1v1005849C1 [Oldenlandia corymbosa var. corymbosa]|uniref:OLC1v1005849C1 n=1 Tax=Oldenlandia corymbosa var. corymbosa TaxID=529605 RepID=A0AAV1DFJ5_OLDCO|nr:OLC1v1005849C1 [Oldenlandia corymbosa var. corymbosa]
MRFSELSSRILVGSNSSGCQLHSLQLDLVDQVIPYVSIGYPFGSLAPILFGHYHTAILRSPETKPSIMETWDRFARVKQLKNKFRFTNAHEETHMIEGVCRFQMRWT